MKTLIIGSGISGCSIARLLKDRNHDVSIIEKKGNLGGLCITKISPNGIKYEPYGARIFHTKNPTITEFVTRFDKFNGYIHRRGVIINKKLFPLPLTKESISKFKDKDKIYHELQNRPPKIDNTNFETACISIFGPTLYSYYIQNYTKKMWGQDPKNLTAEWAPKRLELREYEDDRYFKDEWQGVPINGFTYFLEKMIEGIPLELNTTEIDPNNYDIVISSAPIDETMHFKFGKLPYRSIQYDYKENVQWEKDDLGTINLPQHSKYIRKCNFKIIHKQESPNNWVHFQIPVEADENNEPMYPISTKENNELFSKYLEEICKTQNICPIGRLGLYKYLDMDTAIEVAFDMLPIIENYLNSTPKDRFEKINIVRNKY